MSCMEGCTVVGRHTAHSASVGSGGSRHRASLHLNHTHDAPEWTISSSSGEQSCIALLLLREPFCPTRRRMRPTSLTANSIECDRCQSSRKCLQPDAVCHLGDAPVMPAYVEVRFCPNVWVSAFAGSTPRMGMECSGGTTQSRAGTTAGERERSAMFQL